MPIQIINQMRSKGYSMLKCRAIKRNGIKFLDQTLKDCPFCLQP